MFDAARPMLYITLTPECLTIRNLRSGLVIAEVPELAVSRSPTPEIIGVGSKARQAAAAQPAQAAQLINPFDHPRSLVADFTVAEQVLRLLVRQATGHSFFTMAPIIFIHPLGEPEGGFTQLEYRAFREMALGAGASRVYLLEGRLLTDSEILQVQKQGRRFRGFADETSGAAGGKQSGL